METVPQPIGLVQLALEDPVLREQALRSALNRYVLESCDLRVAIAHAMSLLRTGQPDRALGVLSRINDKYKEATA